MNLEQVLEIWRRHGGTKHGPRVEHWTIPESQMQAFVDELLRQAGLEIVKIEKPINWRDDPEAIVDDDEPQIGRDYA